MCNGYENISLTGNESDFCEDLPLTSKAEVLSG